jgi:hypothetical protein
MEITELSTGYRRKVIIRAVENDDFKILVKKRYCFDWKSFRNEMMTYKLCCVDEPGVILGVIGIVDFEEEMRLEIKLIANSKDNIGRNKKYEGIAGCLIAFSCRKAFRKYGDLACVSLIPKTELIAHYTEKYYMVYAGWQLYLEGKSLRKLIKEYDDEKEK